MSLNIPEQKCDNAIIEAKESQVILSGDIDSAQPGAYLTPFFTQIISDMGDQIKIDVSNLHFLNSSGIKCIVTFIMDRDPLSHVVFVTNPEKTWQRTSLEVIQSLDDDHISIEEITCES